MKVSRVHGPVSESCMALEKSSVMELGQDRVPGADGGDLAGDAASLQLAEIFTCR